MLKFNFSGLWVSTRGFFAPRIRALDRTHAGLVVLGVVVLSFSILSYWTPLGLPNGDAAVYAQQIQQQRFDERSVHLGYYVWGAALNGFRDDFSDRALNLVSAGFGAATIGLLAWISMLAVGSPIAGGVAAVVALGHLTLVENWVWAEVYGPQTFFLVAAFLAMGMGRCVVAGVMLANAVLISPASLLLVPALCLLKPDWRSVMRLGLSGGTITLLAIAPVWQDYFYGNRGLLKASGVSVDVKMAVLKESVEVVFGVFAFLPFLALAAWTLCHRRRLRPLLLFLAVLWAPSFFLGEKFKDVPVQLTLWALLVPLIVLGAWELASRLGERGAARAGWPALWITGGMWALIPLFLLARRQVDQLTAVPKDHVVVALAVAGALAGAWVFGVRWRPMPQMLVVVAVASVINLTWVNELVSHENASIDAYRSQVLELNETADLDYRVVGTWDRGILLEHYLFQRSYTDTWINLAQLEGRWGEEDRAEAWARWQETVEAGHEMWLLDNYPDQIQHLQQKGYGFDSPVGSFIRARPASPRPAGAEPAQTEQQLEQDGQSTEGDGDG